MDIFFLMSIFRFYLGSRMLFEHNGVRKNQFLNACFCWDSRLSLSEMDQSLGLVEPMVVGTCTWSFCFVISKFLD